MGGGGGGITCDAKPHDNGQDDCYGYVEMEINRVALNIKMWSWKGILRKEDIIEPHPRNAGESAMALYTQKRILNLKAKEPPPSSDPFEKENAKMIAQILAEYKHVNYEGKDTDMYI